MKLLGDTPGDDNRKNIMDVLPSRDLKNHLLRSLIKLL